MWRGPNEVQRSEIDAGFRLRLLSAKKANMIDRRRQKDERGKYSVKNTDEWWSTIIKDKYGLTDEVRTATNMPLIAIRAISLLLGQRKLSWPEDGYHC